MLPGETRRGSWLGSRRSVTSILSLGSCRNNGIAFLIGCSTEMVLVFVCSISVSMIALNDMEFYNHGRGYCLCGPRVHGEDDAVDVWRRKELRVKDGGARGLLQIESRSLDGSHHIVTLCCIQRFVTKMCDTYSWLVRLAVALSSHQFIDIGILDN